jgi:hypothetical protein
MVVLFSTGCRNETNSSAGEGKPFLDQKYEVPPRMEWNKEVTARTGGTITFRINSPGPVSVTVVTATAYKALTAGNKKGVNKADVLLTADSKGPTYEGKVALPPGSSYFIIENQTDKKAEIHLQCFAPK